MPSMSIAAPTINETSPTGDIRSGKAKLSISIITVIGSTETKASLSFLTSIPFNISPPFSSSILGLFFFSSCFCVCTLPHFCIVYIIYENRVSCQFKLHYNFSGFVNDLSFFAKNLLGFHSLSLIT